MSGVLGDMEHVKRRPCVLIDPHTMTVSVLVNRKSYFSLISFTITATKTTIQFEV